MNEYNMSIMDDLAKIMEDAPVVFENTDFEFHSFDSPTMQLFLNIEGDWSEQIRSVAEEMMRPKYPKLNICVVLDKRFDTNIILD